MIYENTNQILSEIRKIMKENKISMNELAQRLNRTQPATSGLFRMKNISLDSLEEIANALDLKIDISFIPNNE